MGGIGRIAGPTGGYLIGYLPAVFIIGTLSQKGAARTSIDIIAMACGTIVLYACGVTWLKTLTGMPWSKALAIGMYPFLVGDALKIAAAAAIARGLRPIIKVTSEELQATRIS
jgi:biotin transport system substrate-specific component